MAFGEFQSLTRDSNHSNDNPGPLMEALKFQSLTRDSNHSNHGRFASRVAPKRFQSLTRDSNHSNLRQMRRGVGSSCFNPSRGIAIIQTGLDRLSRAGTPSFNPSRGIAIIQTCVVGICRSIGRFQSLTRDSNHSNYMSLAYRCRRTCFNPSRGIAIIQTPLAPIGSAPHHRGVYGPIRGISPHRAR